MIDEFEGLTGYGISIWAMFKTIDSSRFIVAILQPSVIDITRVIVCFSTPIKSTTSPSGSLMVGNLWTIAQ
jgi:hypothetical protein